MDDQQSPTPFNLRVGANVRAFRQAARMSQADLAAELARHGHPFQQQTILKVEKGSRPLRLEEAAVLAAILRISVLQLLTSVSDRAYELAREALQLHVRLTELRQELTDLEARAAEIQREQMKLHPDRFEDHELAAAGLIPWGEPEEERQSMQEPGRGKPAMAPEEKGNRGKH